MVGARRSSWRVISSIEQKTEVSQPPNPCLVLWHHWGLWRHSHLWGHFDHIFLTHIQSVHSVKMELDLKFNWAPVYSCTHWLKPRNSSPPAFGRCWSSKIKGLFVIPWVGPNGCGFCQPCRQGFGSVFIFTDPDPDPEDPDGGQYGSGSNPDPGL